MNFQKISDILPKFLAKQNMAGVSKDEEVKHKFLEIMNEIFGNEIEKKIEITDLKKGVIYLQVSDNILAQKIQLSSGIILEQMHEAGFPYLNKIYSKAGK